MVLKTKSSRYNRKREIKMRGRILFYVHKILAVVMIAFFVYAFIDSALPTILRY
jgi:hypothetical protein